MLVFLVLEIRICKCLWKKMRSDNRVRNSVRWELQEIEIERQQKTSFCFFIASNTAGVSSGKKHFFSLPFLIFSGSFRLFLSFIVSFVHQIFFFVASPVFFPILCHPFITRHIDPGCMIVMILLCLGPETSFCHNITVYQFRALWIMFMMIYVQ